jgi:DNA polymerase
MRMLELLEGQIADCMDCRLGKAGGGKSLPYWTPLSRFIMVGEAPGREEVDTEPFYGTAGRKLWGVADQFGLRKELFGIINTVQCRPLDGKRNGKPTKTHCDRCFKWVRKFIRVLVPEKGIILGGYAKSVMYDGSLDGIMAMNGRDISSQILMDGRRTPFIISVHPAMMIYKGDEGIRMIQESLRNFKEL